MRITLTLTLPSLFSRACNAGSKRIFTPAARTPLHFRFTTLPSPPSPASFQPITPPHVPLPSPVSSSSKLGPDAQKYFSDNDDDIKSQGSGGSSSSDAVGDALAMRILDVALGHVPALGWTHAALAAAAADLGLSSQSAGCNQAPLACNLLSLTAVTLGLVGPLHSLVIHAHNLAHTEVCSMCFPGLFVGVVRCAFLGSLLGWSRDMRAVVPVLAAKG
jgi:hypothetical protein